MNHFLYGVARKGMYPDTVVIGYEEDGTGRYAEYIISNRELSDAECRHWGLTPEF